jgi:predicted TPR repeat methyltransferase
MAEKKDRDDSKEKVTKKLAEEIKKLIKANPDFGIAFVLINDEGCGLGLAGGIDIHNTLHGIDKLVAMVTNLAKEQDPNALSSFMSEGILKDLPSRMLDLNLVQDSERPQLNITGLQRNRNKLITHDS